MAGVKGRSGGARPGAGRKAKEPVTSDFSDPLDFLRAVWKGEMDANAGQIRAAQAALPFVHPKKGESSGKKEEAEARAKAAGAGRYGRREAPKLVAAGGQKV